MANELEEITKTLIQTKVLEALKSSDEYLETLVKSAFEQKVDEHGQKPSHYSSSREEQPWLQWATKQAIRNAAREVVDRYVEEEIAPKLVDAVRKCLTEEDVARAMLAETFNQVDLSSRMVVDVSFKGEKGS